MNTAPRRLDLRRKLFDLVERFERFQNGGQKSLADRCQREASRRAPENSLAKLGFELRNAIRQRRLCDRAARSGSNK